MSKATAKITDQFKHTYVNTFGKDTAELQKAFFVMGFKWFGSQRKLNAVTDMSYIRVDGDCELYFAHSAEGQITPSEYDWIPESHEVTEAEVIAAAAEVKRIKREESKASKKRRAQRKWEATAIKKTHDGCPVNPDVIVAIKMRDGEIWTERASNVFWGECGGGTIESYKVIGYPKPPRQKPVVSRISQDDMVEALAADLGKGIAKVDTSVDSNGFIAWDGTNYGYTSDDMSGPVAMGTLVDVKYRDGAIDYGMRSGFIDHVGSSGRYPAGAFWHKDGTGTDIVAYRLARGSGAIAEAANTVLSIEREQPDTNPKKQYGVASIPLEMWPDLASAYGALALYNGGLKYGKANFANTPVEASIYIAALRRHLASWVAGEEFDPADGVPHLGGVLANAAILISARAAGTLIDDRMLLSGYLTERDALKALVKPVQELHADKNPKHYTRDQA